jgi:Trk-type K+ transport system membrane component
MAVRSLFTMATRGREVGGEDGAELRQIICHRCELRTENNIISILYYLYFTIIIIIIIYLAFCCPAGPTAGPSYLPISVFIIYLPEAKRRA